MYFFPHFPLQLTSFELFGFVILLGLIGGELAKRFRFLPKISGYILSGFLAGPACFNAINQSALGNLHILVNISLGIILFDLGRYLDFTWLRYDRGLFFIALTESGLTLGLIFILLIMLGFSSLLALIGGIIAVATSPAVVMMVAHDAVSEGPVTRRILMLTSLNTLFALMLFTFILPVTQASHHHLLTIVAHSLYRLLGSLLLGVAMFVVIKIFSYLIGKHKESQFVLFVGVIVLTTSFAHGLHFSIMLALLVGGVAARNFDFDNTLMEVDFGWLAQLFLILLFVAMGINLQVNGLLQATFGILMFIIVRIIAKASGVWLFAKYCRLTTKQTFAISLALTPMAGVAISMSSVLSEFNPSISTQLTLIISSVVAILTLLGPIATQIAFITAHETDVDMAKGIL